MKGNHGVQGPKRVWNLWGWGPGVFARRLLAQGSGIGAQDLRFGVYAKVPFLKMFSLNQKTQN